MMGIAIALTAAVVAYFAAQFLDDSEQDTAAAVCRLIALGGATYVGVRVVLEVIYILFLVEDALKAFTTSLMVGLD